MLRLGHRRVLLNAPSGSAAAAPFSLDAFATDIPGAYSASRSLFTGTSGSAVIRGRNANSTTEGDIVGTAAGLKAADLVALRDGVGEVRLKTLYNQSAIGSAWPHFTQATAGTQLVIESAAGAGNKISGEWYAPTNDNTRYLALSGAVTKTMGASWAAVAVVQYTGAYSSGRAICGGSKSGVGHTWFGQHTSSNQWHYRDLTAAFADNQASMTSYDNGHANAVWDKFSGRPLVICIRVKDGLQELYLNGWKAASDTAASPVGLNVAEWGRAALGGTYFEGYMAEGVFFENADSAGVFAYNNNCLSTFQAKPIVVLSGDSRTTGSGSSGSPQGTAGQYLNDNSVYPAFLIATIGHRTDQGNTAINAVISNFATRYTGAVQQNCMIYDYGINDIIQGISEATIEANVLAGLAAIRAAGMKALVTTLAACVDQSSLTQAKLIAHNAWRRALTSADCDGVIDIGADASIGVGQHGNATYFTDGLHHTNAGYAVKASLYQTALDALYA